MRDFSGQLEFRFVSPPCLLLVGRVSTPANADLVPIHSPLHSESSYDLENRQHAHDMVRQVAP